MSSPGRLPNRPSAPEDDAGGAHRDGVHGGEAGVERGGDEPRPAVGFGFEVGDGDRLAGGIAVDTRPFVGLQLEQFQFAGFLGGGGQQAQLLERVGEQEPGRLRRRAGRRSAR